MLGYAKEDLDNMLFYINMAEFYLPPAQDVIKDGLKEVHSFLSGLWAEGYFD
jgi:hypothetical protein